MWVKLFLGNQICLGKVFSVLFCDFTKFGEDASHRLVVVARLVVLTLPPRTPCPDEGLVSHLVDFFVSHCSVCFGFGESYGLGLSPQPVVLADCEDVACLDREALKGLLRRLGIRRGEEGVELILVDRNSVDEVSHFNLGVNRRVEADILFTLMGDGVRELNPLTPREGLDFTTLALGDAFLDGGEVSEVDARTKNSVGHFL